MIELNTLKDQSPLCYGEILWDVLPTGKKEGGAPLNVAINLKKLGNKISYVGKVGNDELGNDLLDFLDRMDLNSPLMQIDKNLATSEVLVHLDEKNNASYEICMPVAWDNIVLTDELDRAAENAGILIYGSLASRSEQSRNTLLQLIDKYPHLIKVMDVNLRAPFNTQKIVSGLIEHADILKLNEEELRLIASWYNIKGTDLELMKWYIDTFNCTLLCVTYGSNGAYIFTGEQLYHHKGYKINYVDSIGAGDAFLAGLISSLIKGIELEDALAFACATGAYAAATKGAVANYTMEDITHLMSNQ